VTSDVAFYVRPEWRIKIASFIATTGLSPSIIADVFTKKTALLTVRRIKELKELS
jgi:hypothetical protein